MEAQKKSVLKQLNRSILEPERWVDLGGWVHTETVYLSAVTHPSSNRARPA